LKNGVTRESLLGYAPERFSAPVLVKLDSVHLERALDLLLTLYRDIRYSVSPRFELETAVSKLSWLDRWISPPELRAAVTEARLSLGGNVPGGALPDQNAALTAPNAAGRAADERAVYDQSIALGRPGSLAEEFKRRMAVREAQKAETQTPENSGTIPPQVETVRRVFRGTVVDNSDNNSGDGNRESKE
jgi:DNA polymerase-3 subunit gamma/tau